MWRQPPSAVWPSEARQSKGVGRARVHSGQRWFLQSNRASAAAVRFSAARFPETPHLARGSRTPCNYGVSACSSGYPPLARNLFSPMTSFTHCPETSFTLRRAKRAGRWKRNGLEDDVYSATAGTVCGGGRAAYTVF